MKRREFLWLGAAGVSAWSQKARSQTSQARLIGILAAPSEDATDARGWIAAFTDELNKLGWNASNVRIETRWNAVDSDSAKIYAAEIISLKPDAIVAHGATPLVALHQATSTIPIVFVRTTGLIELGLAKSMAHPGGNITGFTNFDYPIAGKWLEFLHQFAPHATNIGVIMERGNLTAERYFQAIQAAASSMQVSIERLPVDTANLQSSIEEFGSQPNRALIVLPSGVSTTESKLIIGMAAKHRLPAIYPYRAMAADGGLVSYGVSTSDVYRSAAGYVARIFKGEKAADLPIQAATKFQLVINLRTAKSLELSVPQAVLATADELIE